jgi:hypothetical protein
MNRQMSPTPILPGIFLIDLYANQVRHDIGQALIVIAFHPYDFDVALWIRKFADETEEFPMLLGEAAEIEVGKDIAQENQSPEAIVLQHIGRLAGATGLRAQMHVG